METPYPPYLHPLVTASVFCDALRTLKCHLRAAWNGGATALRVQEFDKGRGPVGFPADRAGL